MRKLEKDVHAALDIVDELKIRLNLVLDAIPRESYRRPLSRRRESLSPPSRRRESLSPPRRTRQRRDSPSPRGRTSPPQEYSRDSVYVGKTNNVNKEDLRHQFELTYGENMLEFDIAKHGGHVRVVFSDEEAQLRCLNDAASWKRTFGVDISKHFVSRARRN